MRRVPAFLRASGLAVVAVVIAAAGTLALREAMGEGCSPGIAHLATASARVAVATLMGALRVHSAEAQEQLDFKPVPPESSTRFDRLRVTRRARAEALRDSLDQPRGIPDPDGPSSPSSRSRQGSVMRIGSDIHVEEDEVIDGDISAVNGDITVEGHVRGDVVAMGGDVELTSTARVDGDVVCMGGKLTEEPGAEVSGQRVTAPGAGGWRNFRHRGDSSSHDEGGVTGSLVWLLLMMLFAWVLARFAPGRTATALETIQRQPGLSLAIGALVWALIIPSIVALALVVALLCITIIGIPLALAALVGYGLFLAVLGIWGFTVGAIVLGGVLASSRTAAAGGPTPPPPPSLVRRAMVGVLSLSGAILVGHLFHAVTGVGAIRALGTLIIVIAWVASFLATTLGAGALLRSEFVAGTLRRWWAGRRSTSSAPGGSAPVGSAPPPATPPSSPSVSTPGAELPPAPPLT